MQQVPVIENFDPSEETSCISGKTHIGRRKVCVNYHRDLEKLNLVVYRHRNKFYLKFFEWELETTE